MKTGIAIFCAGMLCCSALQAAPAAWYKWRSELSDQQPCAQISPGEGWEKLSGPYRDARCEIPGLPGQVNLRRGGGGGDGHGAVLREAHHALRTAFA